MKIAKFLKTKVAIPWYSTVVIYFITSWIFGKNLGYAVFSTVILFAVSLLFFSLGMLIIENRQRRENKKGGQG